MSFNLSIPTTSKVPLELTVDAGEMLFILGANGTGKSSLMQAFASANSDKARRVTAHRQIWFRSGSPEFTGKQRTDYEGRIFHHDQQANARWMDEYAEQRAQMAIYDLVNSENKRSRSIARAVDEKDTAEINDLSNQDGAFRILNRILRLANLDIAISIEENDEIVATRSDSKPYSIAKLSDCLLYTSDAADE